MKLTLLLCFFVLGLNPAAHSQEGSKPKSIAIEGSSAMVPYVRPIAVKFAKEKGIGVAVRGTGSKVGFECAKAKTCQIGLTSMDLTPEQSQDLVVTHLAFDGVGVTTSKDVTVDNLTTAQLQKIFSGQIKNWNEVGGSDMPLTAWHRRKESSISDLFNQAVKPDVKGEVVGSNEEAINRMKATKGAITYLSLGSALADRSKNVKVIKVDGVEATPENLRNGKYKMKRSFFLVRHKDLAGDANLNALTEELLKGREASFANLGLVMP